VFERGVRILDENKGNTKSQFVNHENIHIGRKGDSLLGKSEEKKRERRASHVRWLVGGQKKDYCLVNPIQWVRKGREEKKIFAQNR